MKEITTALIKAKKNFKSVSFDRKGQRNKYATLKSILIAVEDALLHEGILFMQCEGYDPTTTHPTLETKLVHVSGESISSIALISNDQNSPITNENQRYGAALSYARRYSAMTLLGLYADEDDLDEYEQKAGSSNKASEKQLNYLKQLLKNQQPSIITRIFDKYNVTDLMQLSAKDASEIIEAIKGK